MPAHHTTVAASSCSPEDIVTPGLLAAAALRPVLASMPLSDKPVRQLIDPGPALEPRSDPAEVKLSCGPTPANPIPA